jgi:hypothetical protein
MSVNDTIGVTSEIADALRGALFARAVERRHLVAVETDAGAWELQAYYLTGPRDQHACQIIQLEEVKGGVRVTLRPTIAGEPKRYMELPEHTIASLRFGYAEMNLVRKETEGDWLKLTLVDHLDALVVLWVAAKPMPAAINWSLVDPQQRWPERGKQ